MAKKSRLRSALRPAPPKPDKAGKASKHIRPPKKSPEKTEPRSVRGQSPPVIVGVGASAGGLEAFGQLLDALPENPGIALVFVQHLSPKHGSVLPELLAPHSRMPVVQATNGGVIEENHVYIIPPNTRLAIVEGRLVLSERPGDSTQYTPIDHLFGSLAADRESGAIGIILSGTASDGAIGSREIKAVGGITIAQEPATAKYDGMPRAAIATGMVDLILPPDKIAAELLRIAKHPYLRNKVRGTADAEESVIGDDQLSQIFKLLRKETGVDFTHYKSPTIKRRLRRRLVLHKINDLEQYVAYLQDNPGEVQNLYQDILIHVTRFFREPESFETLAEAVYPKLIENRRPDHPIRVWVPGCSTGEEAYSVAISLLEFLGKSGSSLPVQIFATDISDATIEYARAGYYPATIESDISAERLRRHFTRSDGNYRISKVVRDLCIFARQDLTRDPPFSRLDLIVCRNVLIYLGVPLQKRVLSVFHYALKAQGYLMLAPAETVGQSAELFSAVDKQGRIYRKKLLDIHPVMQFPVDYHLPGKALPKAHQAKAAEGGVVQTANRLLLERYTPAGVLVDNELRIIQFLGTTGPFLEPAPGDASLSLLKMVREGLLYGLRATINEARKTEKPVSKDGIRVRYNGHMLDVRVEVVALHDAHQREPFFLVLFEERERSPLDGREPAKKSKQKDAPKGTKRGNIRRLERELAASRDYMQAVIQDLEAANEELQSANEEILSSNEELQSTNEELDTAKEELQSTNEELNTVNEELHGRNDELSSLNSDLINLLGSIHIAIVMVASDLRIRRYTPMAEKILNLIPGDVGRPIGHIKPNIDVPDLEKLITQVIDEVGTKERDVQDGAGNWFSLRVRPYKTAENKIDGAVLALIDINASRRLETQLKNFAESMLGSIAAPVAILNGELRVIAANAGFCRIMNQPQTECVGKSLDDFTDGDSSRLRGRLHEAIERKSNTDVIQTDFHSPSGPCRVHARLLETGSDRSPMMTILIEPQN